MRRASESESRHRLLRRRAVPWLISFAILTLFATDGAAAETKHVLMLFSNDSLLPAGDALGSSFRSEPEAGDPNRVEIFTEFLDADRFPGPAHEARMESLLRDKYASIAIDLAIAIGPQALDFLIERRASLFARDALDLRRHQRGEHRAAGYCRRTAPGSSAVSIRCRRWSWHCDCSRMAGRSWW